MTKYAHADVLDGGLNAIKTVAIRLLVLKNYTAGQSYATVLTNAICTITVANADFTLSGADAAARVLTTAAKSGTASGSSTGGDDLHFAFTDNVSKVLWVTDETTNQVVTSGNPVNVPALTYTNPQPS